MADSDVEGFEGSLFPVFVTADIPIATINDILKRCADFTAGEELDALEGLVLVSGDGTGFDPTEPTAVPVASSWKSGFVGQGVAEVQAAFEQRVAPGPEEEETAKAASVFVVLDERTARDRSVLLVSLEGGAGAAPVTVRAEPEIAAISCMGPEMGTMGLGEGANDARGDDGVVLLTTARYRHMMEEELAKEEEEGDEDVDYDEDEE